MDLGSLRKRRRSSSRLGCIRGEVLVSPYFVRVANLPGSEPCHETTFAAKRRGGLFRDRAARNPYQATSATGTFVLKLNSSRVLHIAAKRRQISIPIADTVVRTPARRGAKSDDEFINRRGVVD